MALHLAAHTLSDAAPSNILGIDLNASGSLFGTATSEGWVVYETNPLRTVTRHHVPDASLGRVVPIERTNLLLVVGGPPSPLYPPNKVVFWDDKRRHAVAELEFREDVRGLAVRKDRLVVALKRRIIVYRLATSPHDIYREGSYDTCDNPKGLVTLASEPGSTLLAFPGRQTGQVQLVRLPPYAPNDPPLPPPPSHDPNSAPFPSVSIVAAHTSALSALATTPSGSLLATTSKQGTLVRVWDPSTSRLIKELRRGTDTAEIFGLSFRRDGGAIAVSSDKGTVHVWDLKSSREDRRRSGGTDSGSSTPRQKQYSLLKPYLPKYFSSEWSHSQFRLPSPGLPASRLPSFSIPSSHAGASPALPPTTEDDKCICTWVEVELGDDDDDYDDDGTDGAGDAARASTSRTSPSVVALDPTRSPSRGGRASPSRPPPAPAAKDATASVAATATAGSSLRRQSFRSTSTSNFSNSAATRLDPRPSAAGGVPSIRGDAPTRTPRPRRTESQLIAITQSGGWFRVSLNSDGGGGGGGGRGREEPIDKDGGGSPSTSSSRGKAAKSKGEAGVTGLGRDSTSSCRLVEYRRFGTDGW